MQQTQHSAPNGFVVVDPSTGLDEEDSSSHALLKRQSSSLLPLQVLSATATPTPFTEGEIQLVLQYLNANFLQTPVARFPEDFANTPTGIMTMGVYGSTKFDLAGLSLALRAELEMFDIDVITIEPGSFRTAILGKGFSAMKKPIPD
ncbi:hypothetical protein PF005_g15510 [Phytophthora fragariae]|uniref:Cilia- and flagella-associated protein 47 domain-containing protein n=1 Tax=Phytophthora fragariae TaxID=53985 RepID=A0A6A4DAJ4_9STRA|nr:hypothetical protein PF009_g16765 [Phytophthora fragariae]KAE9102293.1 hypothetical protein PF007_g14815 [Phytophthora fragariae]KAE9200033.1 hypothetical protein PF005_g15510 [Phytophthora fragariae]KAE9300528.1 hypothetical protein PF001_g14901 [Phytophthora fragariae]